jgi:tRNA A58 N-methylase Trm61
MICRRGRVVRRRIWFVDVLSPGPGSIAKVVAKSAVRDQVDEVVYWAEVSLEERVEAVEVLRRRMYGGNDGVRPRLQRVCRVTRSA